MAMFYGECVDCNQERELFEHNQKCIICTRLDNIEKEIAKKKEK